MSPANITLRHDTHPPSIRGPSPDTSFFPPRQVRPKLPENGEPSHFRRLPGVGEYFFLLAHSAYVFLQLFIAVVEVFEECFTP